MPYRTIWETKGIHIRYAGHSSDHEIAKAVETFQADARYDELRYIVHDFRDCESVTFSRAAIEELSAKDAAAALSKRKHRVAVVSDMSEVHAMVKAYLGTGLHPEGKVRVFSELESARTWACRS